LSDEGGEFVIFRRLQIISKASFVNDECAILAICFCDIFVF